MQEKKPEHDEIVLCTVEKILGTTVFVRIDKYGKEGVIATSEIAPGRIRNIRDYVTPGRKIVCKILRIDEKSGHLDLSLRRVSVREKKEALERSQKEKDFVTVLKIVLGERAKDIVDSIIERYGDIYSFLQSISENALESLGLPKEESNKLFKMLTEKREREIFLNAKISLSNQASEGASILRGIFKTVSEETNGLRIIYTSAPNYSISISSKDYKDANKKLDKTLARLSELAKSSGCNFAVIK